LTAEIVSILYQHSFIWGEGSRKGGVSPPP